MQNLIDLWKNEDRKNPHKIIYNLCFDGEEQSQPGRAFSKICKLVENNQYGFAMNLTIQKKKEERCTMRYTSVFFNQRLRFLHMKEAFTNYYQT